MPSLQQEIEALVVELRADNENGIYKGEMADMLDAILSLVGEETARLREAIGHWFPTFKGMCEELYGMKDSEVNWPTYLCQAQLVYEEMSAARMPKDGCCCATIYDGRITAPDCPVHGIGGTDHVRVVDPKEETARLREALTDDKWFEDWWAGLDDSIYEDSNAREAVLMFRAALASAKAQDEGAVGTAEGRSAGDDLAATAGGAGSIPASPNASAKEKP